jgi:hypothetical protein
MLTLPTFIFDLAKLLRQWLDKLRRWAGLYRVTPREVSYFKGRPDPAQLPTALLQWEGCRPSRLEEIPSQPPVAGGPGDDWMKPCDRNSFGNQNIIIHTDHILTKSSHCCTNPLPSGQCAQKQNGPKEPAPVPR